MTLAAHEEIVDAEIVPDELTRQEARELTDRIRVGLDTVWNDVAEAYTRVAHKALGYDSWDDYCATEFGSNRIKLPKEDRPEQIRSMYEQGVSIKAIVTATGVARNTVRNDLRQGGQIDPPERQLGQDGKTYARPEPTVSERDWPVVPDPTPEERIQKFEDTRERLINEGYLPKPRTEEERKADAKEFVESLIGTTKRQPSEPVAPEDKFAKALNAVGAAIRINHGVNETMLNEDGWNVLRALGLR